MTGGWRSSIGPRRLWGRGAQPVAVRRLAMPALFLAASLLMALHVLGWWSWIRPDEWSYAAWGRQIAAGQFHLVALPTYPTPLGYILGVVVAPFAPWRAIPAVITIALAGAVAATFRSGVRVGGAAGGILAASCLALTGGFATSLQWSTIDGLNAAFVALAIASGGRRRAVLLVAAGLARPEAWPVAALAVYLSGDERRRRYRLAVAAAAGLAAPVIWAAVDWWLWGVPFAFLNQLHGKLPGTGNPLTALARLGGVHALAASGTNPPRLGYLRLTGAVRALYDATAREAGVWLILLAAVGLVVIVTQARGRDRSLMFLPLATVVWAAMLVVEMQNGLQPYSRYMFPLTVMLAAGVAPLGGIAHRLPIAKSLGRRSVILGACACTALTVFVTYRLPADPPPRAAQAERIVASLPRLRAALSCGGVGVYAVRRLESPQTAMLALIAGVPISQVPTIHNVEAARKLAAVVRPPGVGGVLPPGVVVTAPIGTIVFGPACARRLRGGADRKYL